MPLNPGDTAVDPSTLTDYQFALDFFVMGKGAEPPGLATGSTLSLVEVTGLDTPDANTSTSTRLKGHGAYVTSRYHKERVITLAGYLRSSAENYTQDTDALKLAFLTRDDACYLFFKLPGYNTRQLLVKPQGVKFPVTSVETAVGYVEFIATVTAEDPRIQDALTPKTLNAAVAGATTSIATLAPYPYDFTSAPDPTILAANIGSCSAPIIATFNGPLTNPVLTSTLTGEQFGLTIVIAGGDLITCDSTKKTIVDGATPHYAALNTGSRFLEVPAKALAKFSLAASAGSGSVDVAWRDTWL